jgi:ribosomal protein L37AE/L43A
VDAYIYNADIYCEQCGEEIRERILNERSLEQCPTCKQDLCHIEIDGEDVFGCVKCQKEISRGDAYIPFDINDESSFDSDEFPKGPYGDGGGESDSPQHCGSGEACINGIDLESDPSNGAVIRVGCFLENDLTTDGVNYLNEMILEHKRNGRGNEEVLKLWYDYYGQFYELEPLEEEEDE